MATSFFNNNCADDVEEIESAKNYADLARDWAIKLDGLVDGIDFSAKFWAQQAAESSAAKIVVEDDGVPLGSDFNVLNFGVGISVLQTASNEVQIQASGDVFTEIFVDGVDYTAGTSTDIVLSEDPVSEKNIDIYFDGIRQQTDTYDVSGTMVTFTTAIPVGVGSIEVVRPRTLDVGVATAQNIMYGVTGVTGDNFFDQTLLTFSSIAAMKAATWLVSGMKVGTTGFNSEGDKGQNEYNIGTFGVADDIFIFDLANGLQAQAITPNGDVRIEQFGAVGDGVTDDGAIFIALRVLNQPIELQPGKVYALGSQVVANGDNQGFFCRNGVAEILVLTGAGKFDRSDYTGSRFDANAMPFLCESFDNYTFKNIHVRLQTGNGVRTVGALSVRGGRRADVNVEVSAFTETQNGVVNIDSVEDGNFVVNGHDIGTSNDTLATMQITVCDIDNSRLGVSPNRISTTNTTVVAFGENILLSGAALAKYGQQTDGVNVSGGGADPGNAHGLRVISRFKSVGDVFDCFSSYVQAYVQAEDSVNNAVKLIHGAQHNRIKLICGATTGVVVTISGSDQAIQPTAYNYIDAVADGANSVRAIHFASPTAAQLPEYNYIKAVVSNAGSLTSIVDFEAGNNNTVEYIDDAISLATPSRILATAGANNLARGINKSNFGYTNNRDYSGSVLDITSTTPVTLVADTLYGSPFIVLEEHRFRSISIRVSTGSAGTVRLGVYRWSESGVATDLIADLGTVDVSASGQKDLSINAGGGITLRRGAYILALVSDATPDLYSTPSSDKDVVSFFGSNQMGASPPARISAAFTFGALPATFPAVSYDTGNIPNVALGG